MKFSNMFWLLFSLGLLHGMFSNGQQETVPEVVVSYIQIINDSEDGWGAVIAQTSKLVIRNKTYSSYFTKYHDTILKSRTGELRESSNGEKYNHQFNKFIDKSLVLYSFNSANKILVSDTISLKFTFGHKEKKILDYNCKQAFASFRGRDYEFYYAPALNYADGPFKFMGLPGLILQVKSFDDEVVIIAKKIEIGSFESQFDYKNMSLEDQQLVSYKIFVDSYLKSMKLGMLKLQQEFSSESMQITDYYYTKRFIEIYEK